MNIYHIVGSIQDEASGPSYSVSETCKKLIDINLDVELITYGGTKTYGKTFFPEERLKMFKKNFYLKKLGFSDDMYEYLTKSLKKSNETIVHHHSLWMMYNIYVAKLKNIFNFKSIISPRGTLSEWAYSSGSLFKPIFWNISLHKALSSNDCFHATSFSEYLDIRRRGFKHPVSIISNGIENFKINMTSSNESSNKKLKTLLFLGRIHKKKGFDLLIPAWSAIQERCQDWQLRIVGPDDGYLPKLKKLIRDFNLKRVKIINPKYGDQKNLEYHDADLFILPTFSENFGMTVAESLIAGTPVVVTSGAPWQDIEKMKAGWTSDISVESLTSTLDRAMHTGEKDLKEMGRNGSLWMQNDFRWKPIANKMKLTYDWLNNKIDKPDWILID